MDFWTWLVQSGLISGDPSYYSSGRASSAEVAHAIRTAVYNLPGASDDRAAVEFYRRLRDTGAYAGDYNYYASGGAAASEIEHLINTASGHLYNVGQQAAQTPPPAPAPAPAPNPPPPSPGPTPPPATPATPTPPPATAPPVVEPIDYEARVAVLFPYLPQDLVRIFADAWADTGDQSLALATMRASTEYAQHFPGIKRADGSLRMSEQEWFSTREAYGRLFSEYGLNSSLFTDRFTELMEGDVSAQELASRLGGAYDAFVTNIPQVAQIYAQYGGIEMSEQALFASFIDPTVGEAILNRRISVAQVGGEALARGFSIGQQFAEQLAFAGVDQMKARQLFSTAEGQLPTLDELARRFRDPDPTFDIEEYAAASIFGDADQTRRINRLIAQSRSLFSEQIGTIRTSENLAVTGLSAR